MLNHAHLFVTFGYYLLPTARYNKPCTSAAGPLPVQPKWNDGVTVELATKITCHWWARLNLSTFEITLDLTLRKAVSCISSLLIWAQSSLFFPAHVLNTFTGWG